MIIPKGITLICMHIFLQDDILHTHTHIPICISIGNLKKKTKKKKLVPSGAFQWRVGGDAE